LEETQERAFAARSTHSSDVVIVADKKWPTLVQKPFPIRKVRKSEEVLPTSGNAKVLYLTSSDLRSKVG